MESYMLLNKQVLRFLGATQNMNRGLFIRRSENSAKVNLVPCNQTAVSKSLNEKILQLGNHDKMFEVQIILCKATPPNGPTHEAGYMKLEAKGENHILHKIWCMTHGNIKVNWEVSDFGVMNDQGNVITDSSTGWEFEGNDLFPSHQCLVSNNADDPFGVAWIYTSLAKFENIPAGMMDCWENRKSFIGTFSIFITLEGLPLSGQLIFENELVRKCQKMLHEKVQTDLHLVSKNGRLVKCHRAMLAVSSKILSRKLKRENGKLEVDFMQHLSFECIKTVLNYMYCGDVSKVTPTVKFAIEILQAAIDFRLIKLISLVTQYLVSKSRQEFLVDNAVKLFLILKTNSVEKDSNGSGDEDESSDSDNESQEGEDENESQEDERNEDDDSEAESDRDVNGPQRTGKGIRLSARTRKRVYQNGHGSGLKKARNQIDDNLARISGTSAVMNGNGVPHSGTNGVNGNNVNCAVEENADDYLHYWNLLEKQAKDVILWYLKNSPNSLNEAVKYHQLKEFPEVLSEIFNLTMQYLQQQQEENI